MPNRANTARAYRTRGVCDATQEGVPSSSLRHQGARTGQHGQRGGAGQRLEPGLGDQRQRPLCRLPVVASNLVVGDTNFVYDVFIRDRQAASTVRASVCSDGTEGGLSLASFLPSLSADGAVVAFASEADLVSQDGGFPVDVFVHDH